ncbi:MAG TPA: phosphatidylserine decarboxylase [Bryobacteraceae bacterium]|nr:phosphatidylserine decarboxylase [Bryobacteraceae bacterium]
MRPLCGRRSGAQSGAPVSREHRSFPRPSGRSRHDSPRGGLVAVLPICRSFVSRVNLTPEIGAKLLKGDEFGFFMFGGSDIVMLFQSKRVVIDAKVGTKYLQGQRNGEIR